jgi:ATP-dependent DNA helicase RecG
MTYLKHARESEDRVEFKAAQGGNFSFNGGAKPLPKDRRHRILRYVVALANEGGGLLVFGMAAAYPHNVVGTQQSVNACGQLAQAIYRELRVRVETVELQEDGKRVLVVVVPPRPIGRALRFEDVPLMRVGEELLPMSDEQHLKIIQEQEPDFSKRPVPSSLRFDDLSAPAIREHLPQAGLYLEYRNEHTKITFDDRRFLQGPYMLLIDEVWATINLRNGKVPVQQGPRIFDIDFFNEEVIREAVHNAISHRDYRRASEVIIKQSPTVTNGPACS